ncbi:hypothetical protein [Dictyobacter alpinus]|uniref:hypothetical protein n=1 Tax=Dictyobacter alpinus TaxID=2014873 RepID=UPI000F843EC1|nr:hypothetical protein [Dictyobacter alpinus]
MVVKVRCWQVQRRSVALLTPTSGEWKPAQLLDEYFRRPVRPGSVTSWWSQSLMTDVKAP